jgi:hypothetical protein
MTGARFGSGFFLKEIFMLHVDYGDEDAKIKNDYRLCQTNGRQLRIEGARTRYRFALEDPVR